MENIELSCLKKKIDDLYRCMMHHYKTNFNKHAVGLYGENFGIANFLYMYGKAFNNLEAQKTADSIIEETMTSHIVDKYPSLASGLVGDCLALSLLQKNNFINSEIDPKIHDYLFKELMNLIRKDTEWDLLHGFLGYALYFLNNSMFGNNDSKALHAIVIKLKEKAEIYENMYRYRRIFIRPGKITTTPILDNYDISLSHGMTGIVLVLLKIYNRQIDRDLTKQLIFSSIKYILSTQIKGESYCLFPSSVRLGNSQPSRLAWCYGDLGIAWCLWKVGRTFGEDNWSKKALEIFHRCAQRRQFDETSIVDAGFCHGSAGVAYFFKRIYDETRDCLFKETAEYWISDLLKRDVFKDCKTGYKAYYLGKWYESFSLLEGVSGIGLVLLSFLDGNDYWNKFFLLD